MARICLFPGEISASKFDRKLGARPSFMDQSSRDIVLSCPQMFWGSYYAPPCIPLHLDFKNGILVPTLAPANRSYLDYNPQIFSFNHILTDISNPKLGLNKNRIVLISQQQRRLENEENWLWRELEEEVAGVKGPMLVQSAMAHLQSAT